MVYDIYIYRCNGTSDRKAMYGCTLQIYNGFTIGEFPNEVEMSEIKISDLFELETGFKKYNISKCEKGDIPCIGTSSSNNGIIGYVKEVSYDSKDIPIITLTETGSTGQCFVQRGKICIGHSANQILKLKGEYSYLNKSLGLIALLMTIKFKLSSYSYLNGLNKDRILNETIQLPTIKGKINENLLNSWVYDTLL